MSWEEDKDYSVFVNAFIEKLVIKKEISTYINNLLIESSKDAVGKLSFNIDFQTKLENMIMEKVGYIIKKYIEPLTEKMDLFEVLQKNQKILEEQHKAIKELISKNEKLSERLVMIYMKNNGTIESIDKLLDTNK